MFRMNKQRLYQIGLLIFLVGLAALPLTATPEMKPGRPPDTTITRRPPHCNPGLPYDCTPTPSPRPTQTLTPVPTATRTPKPTLTPFPTFDPSWRCNEYPYEGPCWWGRTQTAVAMTVTAYYKP